jgi:hypothetical protein
MNQTQYRQFLNDPAGFLNDGPVKRLRININLGPVASKNTDKYTASYPGAVPTVYQYSDSLVTQVFFRYDITGIAATSALWVTADRPAGESYISDRAYYLQWEVDKAYAITLGYAAQLFFTAQLTGCGILVFQSPQALTVIHHNMQVAAEGQSFLQRIFESQRDRSIRQEEYKFDVRAQALQGLATHIVSADPDVIRGTALDSRQYLSSGNPASVFGVKRNERWRIFVNHNTSGVYQTELLYSQS